MRCSKCNSPIISGEEYCKICGTRIDIMPNVEKKEKEKVEVINLDVNNEIKETVSEQLDEINMIAPVDESMDKKSYVVDNSSFDKDEEVFGVTLTDINMKPIVLGSTIKMPSITEEDIKAYENKKINENNSLLDEIDEVEENEEIETFSGTDDNEEIDKVEKIEEVKKEYDEDYDHVTLDDLPIINEEPKKKETKKEKKEIIKENTNTTKQGKNDLAIVIIAILLVISVVLNIYLFLVNGSKDEPIIGASSTITKTAKVMFEGYKMDIKSGWITEYDIDNSATLMYDNSSEWLASIQIIDEIDYDTLINNSEDFAEDMKELKFEFTSNYAKSYDKKNYYLFKGKNESTTAYLIVSKIDKDTIATATVSFKDEVDDKLVKNIAMTIGTIDEDKSEERKPIVSSSSLSEIVKKYGVKEEKTDTKENEKEDENR